jgi:3-deoxy-D-manno-octulosonate 8-phosphate phosphatase (KDO 8-P phosphatase)
MALPKLIATDIDGVWTDGAMYYSEAGEEVKRFHTYDSAGVVFCRQLGIPVVILTGEASLAVKRRAEKLQITYCFTGLTDKLAALRTICGELGVMLDEVAYVGDDINDVIVLQAVGISACPASAPEYIKKIAGTVLTKKGGEGAFREFVERILEDAGLLEQVLYNYLLKKPEQ